MHYKQYSKILSSKNGINIYRGCTHGCVYCDSRSRCYNLDHLFEDIEVKKDSPKILDIELSKKRKKFMIGTGSMCDPYIPLEEQLNMTRECLKVIDRRGFGLSILTKSNKIIRDLDILKSINSKTKCVVQTTLTTFDEDLCKIIEPNVCTTKQRFEMLKLMQKNKIPTVVWLGPILPFINDMEENLRGILNYCIEAGVRGIMCFGFGVTMRDGNREYFYSCLDRYFPGMKEKYIKTFASSYICGSLNHDKLFKIFEEACIKNNIMCKTDEVFRYLNKFEERYNQISFFK